MNRFFESNSLYGNVVFNFTGNPLNDLYAFAVGYRESAQHLVQRFSRSKGYRDFEGYPIFFLYRHSLELFLKSVVYKAGVLSNLVDSKKLFKDEFIFKDHRIHKFIPILSIIFENRGWDMEKLEFNLSKKDFVGIIKDLSDIDPLSFAFRYPVDKKSVSILDKGTTINVFGFANTIEPCLETLDTMYFALNHEFESYAEFMELSREYYQDLI